MKRRIWTRLLLSAVLLTITGVNAKAQFTVDFEKPQTPADFPAQFYDWDKKPVTIDKNTGGITVTFNNGELLTDLRGLLFPGKNGGGPNKTTFYASQYPPTYNTGNTITMVFSKPVRNVTFLLMNDPGDERTFTISVNGKNDSVITLKDSTNFRVTPNTRRGITKISVYSSSGDVIVASWRFGVDDIDYSLDDPSS